MSQNYLILSPEAGEMTPTVIITNHTISTNDNCDDVLSAGKVTFIKGQFSNVEVDITHGNISLGIAVDTARAEIDKKLIEQLFL